ncbi:MAG: glutathione S-transferase N-terminal domain-containing protein, partial [Vicinamibacterales bacterium]
MIKLYSYWRSTAAYRVRIALNLKGLNYETVSINLVKEGGEHKKDDYARVNPQRLVPALVDGSANIGQSAAILEYLEEKYPKPAILPRDVHARAFARQIAQIIACDIHPLNN